MHRIRAIVTDYDDTIAENGFVPPKNLDAMARFRASGRLLILDTGRGRDDLAQVFPDFNRFDKIVVENGAVLYDPKTGEERLLAEPLPAAFLDDLRRRGVSPVPQRRVIVDTRAVYRRAITEAINAAGLHLNMIFNKDSVLVLPQGVDKGFGLRHALAGSDIALEDVAGIGDAENDHELLDACGVKVAVPNALPALRAKADCVMTFIELVNSILVQ